MKINYQKQNCLKIRKLPKKWSKNDKKPKIVFKQ